MTSRQALEERAKRIVQYYIRHGKDKKRTYAHFMDEGLHKRTIVTIIKRHDEETNNHSTTDEHGHQSEHDKQGTSNLNVNTTKPEKKPLGRKPTVTTPEMFDKIANLFKEKPDLSCREAAKTLNLSRTTIFRIIRKMKEKNIEINKVIASEPRCPTCHQRIKDVKKAAKILKNETKTMETTRLGTKMDTSLAT